MDFVSSSVTIYVENEVEVIGFGNLDELSDTWIILSRSNDPGAEEESRDEMIGIQESTREYVIDAAIESILLSLGPSTSGFMTIRRINQGLSG